MSVTAIDRLREQLEEIDNRKCRDAIWPDAYVTITLEDARAIASDIRVSEVIEKCADRSCNGSPYGCQLCTLKDLPEEWDIEEIKKMMEGK